MEVPEKCPICGSKLPKPRLDEVRIGGTLMKDGTVGVPKKALVAVCGTRDCGYAYIRVIEP